MFSDPRPTAWDLKWTMLGTPVRVHPLFWLATAIFGWQLADPKGGGSLKLLALWIACVFFSILLHEFGHIWAGRLFGRRGHIVLYSFGGLAIGASDLSRRWQRIIVYLAGPGIQLALYGVLNLVLSHGGEDFISARENRWMRHGMAMLLEINFAWPILNLLPIWPLDGGQVSREIFEIFSRNGFYHALWLSLIASVGLAVYFFQREKYYLVFLFAWLALDSFQLIQVLRQSGPRHRDEEWRDRAEWEQDPDYWKK